MNQMQGQDGPTIHVHVHTKNGSGSLMIPFWTCWLQFWPVNDIIKVMVPNYLWPHPTPHPKKQHHGHKILVGSPRVYIKGPWQRGQYNLLHKLKQLQSSSYWVQLWNEWKCAKITYRIYQYVALSIKCIFSKIPTHNKKRSSLSPAPVFSFQMAPDSWAKRFCCLTSMWWKNMSQPTAFYLHMKQPHPENLAGEICCKSQELKHWCQF